MSFCTTNADCDQRFYCDTVLMWCSSCRVICDPKTEMDFECKTKCPEFFDEIHSTEQITTTAFVLFTTKDQNLLALAETTSPGNRASFIIGFVLVMTMIVLLCGCTVMRCMAYYKPESRCGQGITRLMKKIITTLCSQKCQKIIIPKREYVEVASNPSQVTANNAYAGSNKRLSESDTETRDVERASGSGITEQLTKFDNKNETNCEEPQAKKENSGFNSDLTDEVPNSLHKENPTTVMDQIKMKPPPQPSTTNHTENSDDKVIHLMNATDSEKKSSHSSKTQPGCHSNNPKQSTKSSPNQSNSTVQVSSRERRNDSRNKKQENPLAVAAGHPQFDLDIYSTIPKQEAGFSKEFKPTSQPVSVMDGGADLVQETQQTPSEAQIAQAASSNRQDQNNSKEHPNKKIYDVLKNIEWVQGYYSEGSSIEVFANLHHINRETALKELAMKTRSYPEKFHLKHESGAY